MKKQITYTPISSNNNTNLIGDVIKPGSLLAMSLRKRMKKLQLYCGELLPLQRLLKPWLLLRTSSIVLLADDSGNDYGFHTYFVLELLS